MSTIELRVTVDEADEILWALDYRAEGLRSQADEDEMGGFPEEAEGMRLAAADHERLADKVRSALDKARGPRWAR